MDLVQVQDLELAVALVQETVLVEALLAVQAEPVVQQAAVAPVLVEAVPEAVAQVEEPNGT